MTKQVLRADELHQRRMIRGDMPGVLAIDAESFEFRWLKENFLRCLRLGRVVEREGQILGRVIYRLKGQSIELLRLAVRGDCRRQGIGTAMVARLKRKLTRSRRRRLVTYLSERNVPSQLFFRAQRFRAVKMLAQYWAEDDDAIKMAYRPFGRSPTNRIARYLESAFGSRGRKPTNDLLIHDCSRR